MPWGYQWKPYVPVARRRADAAKYAVTLARQEKRTLCPVKIAGRKMAQSFWGQAWCENLESYSDFSNRLPRGRTYARNGSVIDLQIERGQIKAIVSGSDIYRVTVTIGTLAKSSWKKITQDCSQSFDSLIDLLQGRFDQGIMRRLTQRADGLFPQPQEIQMKCSCPDYATLCKHVAATLYGVGARLDAEPELLFSLRDVDHLELIGQAATAENLDRTLNANRDAALGDRDLGELFGIELETDSPNKPAARPKRSPTRKASAAEAKAAVAPKSRRNEGAATVARKPATKSKVASKSKSASKGASASAGKAVSRKARSATGAAAAKKPRPAKGRGAKAR